MTWVSEATKQNVEIMILGERTRIRKGGTLPELQVDPTAGWSN